MGLFGLHRGSVEPPRPRIDRSVFMADWAQIWWGGSLVHLSHEYALRPWSWARYKWVCPLIHVYVCVASFDWPRVWLFVVLPIFPHFDQKSMYMQINTNTYEIC